MDGCWRSERRKEKIVRPAINIFFRFLDAENTCLITLAQQFELMSQKKAVGDNLPFVLS